MTFAVGSFRVLPKQIEKYEDVLLVAMEHSGVCSSKALIKAIHCVLSFCVSFEDESNVSLACEVKTELLKMTW